jgi:hypothetical protein
MNISNLENKGEKKQIKNGQTYKHLHRRIIPEEDNRERNGRKK